MKTYQEQRQLVKGPKEARCECGENMAGTMVEATEWRDEHLSMYRNKDDHHIAIVGMDRTQHLSRDDGPAPAGVPSGEHRRTLCGVPFDALSASTPVYDFRDGFDEYDGAPQTCGACRQVADPDPLDEPLHNVRVAAETEEGAKAKARTRLGLPAGTPIRYCRRVGGRRIHDVPEWEVAFQDRSKDALSRDTMFDPRCEVCDKAHNLTLGRCVVSGRHFLTCHEHSHTLAEARPDGSREVVGIAWYVKGSNPRWGGRGERTR